jgi:hypothetical protein
MLRLQVSPSVSVNTLNLKEISCTYRCVWCSAGLGQLQTSHVHINADASKDTSSDAGLTANGKQEGRSHLSEAKERTTVILMQGFISLMGEAR